MELSELMYLERKATRTTLRTLSEATGIGLSRLVQIEEGDTQPTRKEKDAICKTLGIYHKTIINAMPFDRWYRKLLTINVNHGEFGLDHPLGSCCYRDVLRNDKVKEALKIAWKEELER